MQQGGSPYGAPPRDSLIRFSSSPSSAAAAPPLQQQQMAVDGGMPFPRSAGFPLPPSSVAASNYEELGAAEVDPLGNKGGAGDGGNRWPRQETLALLKIRSDMDATFRDATLKGPLWEEISRKLAELGYRRSGKKCKEKFENVHKYYKRTKEGRAGRQDGKSYRFFTQLEALHGTAAAAEPSHFTPAAALPAVTTAAAAAAMGTPTAAAPVSAVTNQSPLSVAARFSQTPPPQQQQQISAPTPIATAPPPQQQQQPMPMPMPMLGHEHQQKARSGMSFSSNSTSSDALDSDGDDGEEEDDDDEATEEGLSSGKKRKRVDGGAGGRKMMALFEGLMRQVMERQEAMQQRFLEAIEKREQDRVMREETWRRQEIGRLAREQELAAGERAAAAARDAVVISFLQKVTGQTVPIPSHAATAPAPAPAPAPATVSIVQTPPPLPLQIHPQKLTPPPSQPPIQQQQQQQQPPPKPPLQLQSAETVRHQYHQPQKQKPPPPPLRPTSSELVPLSSDPYEGGATMSVSLDPASSSRWPKSEVHALIKLRSELDSRYQESGPKGPLWEEISAGMRRLGYNRSSKRCKEKWENINKYFRKVKESNKKRPEDAKTCPYFHQLDALYRKKLLSSGGGGGGVPALTNRPHEHESHLNPSPIAKPISVMPPSLQQQQQQQQQQQLPPTMNQGEMDGKKGSNGGMSTTFFGDSSAGGNGDNSTKKPEDIVKELMGQSGNDYGRLDEPDSDNMDEEEDDDDDEDEEDGKGQYTIEFQRPNVGRGSNANSSSGGASAAGPPNSGGKAAGSFLAMVR